MTTINNQSVTLDTTVPTMTIGQIQLSADRRGTKEKPLSDSERIRRVVLPAGYWGELSATLNDQKSQSLTDVLRVALTSIASDRLKDTLAAEPMTRTLPLSDFTVAELLRWNAETAATASSITFTREQVENWFDGSATAKVLQAKYAAAGKPAATIAQLLSFVRNRFAATAAKNHGLKEATDATKLTALIDDADLDGKDAALMVELVGRLESINKTLTAKANESTISMDDL